jgi:hypothetical protein
MMSVSIYYRPVSDTGKRFNNGLSKELEKLKAMFGSDLELDESAIPILRAMATAADSAFYDEVADKIEKIGSIKIWGVW